MYPKAYIDYLIYFHGYRDYFECHEVLEEFWKHTEPSNRQSVWVAFIQLAVALYHHRNENYKGAYRILKKAIHIFEKNIEQIDQLGLDGAKLFPLLNDRLQKINNEQRYDCFVLPIDDNLLLAACLHECNKREIDWNNQSDLSNQYLLHKHSLRDRTPIIIEREKQLLQRKRKNKRPSD